MYDEMRRHEPTQWNHHHRRHVTQTIIIQYIHLINRLVDTFEVIHTLLLCMTIITVTVTVTVTIIITILTRMVFIGGLGIIVNVKIRLG
jgi:hypothetical protein